MLKRVVPIVVLISAGAAACGDIGTGVGASTPSVAGAYVYSEALSGAGSNPICTGGGTLTLTQSGSTLSGTLASTGQCTRSDGVTYAYVHSGTLTQGQISGNDFSFRTPSCGVSGVVDRRTQTTSLAATVTCSTGLGGGTPAVSGVFTANK